MHAGPNSNAYKLWKILTKIMLLQVHKDYVPQYLTKISDYRKTSRNKNNCTQVKHCTKILCTIILRLTCFEGSVCISFSSLVAQIMCNLLNGKGVMMVYRFSLISMQAYRCYLTPWIKKKKKDNISVYKLMTFFLYNHL